MTMPLSHPGYVVDTSVVVKWYIERDESGVAKAFRLLEVYGRGQCTLRAPQLLLWEVANALTIGCRLQPSTVSEALAHLRGLDLDLKSVRWSTLQKAVEIASASDAAVYESYFLALALESDCILVTADEAFLRKVHRYPGIISLTQLRLPD